MQAFSRELMVSGTLLPEVNAEDIAASTLRMEKTNTIVSVIGY